ncbi:ABC-type enterochelin transport system ATPase subunit [Aminobacter lissarensis]|uniref:ABC-type enterochelin transport system ATPase subunit n=1 Tax=Aminobacter carboxidus TaxID=376165 RepID=A0A8E1WCA0_9HYPH|nr:ABC-type enterochelin transport system ATPase subunit [Aminobacter lissarensis]
MTALVGPNGPGNSSLLSLSLIARLQPLQGGSISVDGLAVDTLPRAGSWRGMASVFHKRGRIDDNNRS